MERKEVEKELARPRVLLVEDDADQRQLIREALCLHYRQDDGRNVVAVGTARECLALDLRAFDVILQDYNLPDMTGLGLLEEVLRRVDAPVIIVTSDHSAATAALAIQAGAQDYIIKVGDYLFAIPILIEKSLRQHRVKKENERLQLELQSMLSRLRLKNIQLQESLEKLKTMATTDHLTGLLNRRSFKEALERSYNEAIRYGFDLTCCMCDLDNYKRFNDTLGHQAGDELLSTTAEVVRETLRSTDLAARYGGDEFVLLLPHAGLEQATEVLDRLRRTLVTTTSRLGKLKEPVTLSVGVASLGTDKASTADALVAMADRALYAAKERGKDRVVAFRDMSKPSGGSDVAAA